MVQGRKRVEHIPKEWVVAVRQQVDRGRQFKEAVTELFVLNAELLFIQRRQQPPNSSQKRTGQ
jgi:hypothetical protein